MSSSKLFYSKRYGESDFFKNASQESSQNSKGTMVTDLKNAESCRYRLAESHNCHMEKTGCQCGLIFQADIARINKSKRFITMAESFSEKHKVSMDIFREKCCIDVWLYFSTEIIMAERKKDLLKLIRMCNELMIIPRPRGKPEWCDYSVILTYITHNPIIR